MSHFTVAVFTNPTQTVEALLAPFHEFECTGTVDQYVQNVDKMEEARENYRTTSYTRYKDPDGVYHEPYGDEFYRDPTEEELQKIGIPIGSGNCGGMGFATKDWGDGQGSRLKVGYIPDGYVELEVPVTELMSFAEFVEDYYGFPTIAPLQEPDLHGDHMWGWTRINEDDEVIEVIRRTNPNSKWDWYSVGGRWNGMLLVKENSMGEEGELGVFGYRKQDENPAPEGYRWVDTAFLGDICFDKMKELGEDRGRKVWAEVMAELEEHKDDPNYKSGLLYFRYGYKPGMTEEEFLKGWGEFGTYAVIASDGVWYEKGEMGWFGCSSETDEEAKAWDESFFDRFIKDTDPQQILTIVDCHI